ncbi:hypothetical protein [Oceanisphaera psychrotolerans]|uniref:Uncharacterized protein n=1 Tax=Oceanisphaera psychrotolerans TaxID=1414654 RepID=A0A1J4QGQ3_9GAMM|nr:hypothetical protein [Oceanisphaera psychrotolerans]OIN12936.1 hypothetical protein BFR47_11210 [Oceanisphaera psychrotolerans]
MGVDLLIQTLLPAFAAGAIGWWRPSAFWWLAGLAVWVTMGWASGWYWWPTKGTQWLPMVFWAVALAELLPGRWRRLLAPLLISGVFLLALWPLLARYPEALLGLVVFWLWQGWCEWRCGTDRAGLGFAAGGGAFAITVAIDGSLLLAQLAGALAVLAGFLWLSGLSRSVSDRQFTGAYVLLLTLCWQYIPMDWWIVALALVPPWVEQGLRRKGAWRSSLAAIGAAVLVGALSLWLVWPQDSLY